MDALPQRWCNGCNNFRRREEFGKMASGFDRKTCNRHLRDDEKKSRPKFFDEYSTLLSDIHSWAEEVSNMVFQISRIASSLMIFIFIWMLVDVRDEIERPPRF